MKSPFAAGGFIVYNPADLLRPASRAGIMDGSAAEPAMATWPFAVTVHGVFRAAMAGIHYVDVPRPPLPDQSVESLANRGL